MKQWESSNPVGTVPGDALPGAPELARRGNITTGYRELDLVHPGQLDLASGKQQGLWKHCDRKLTVSVWYPAVASAQDQPAVFTDYMGRIDLGNLTPFRLASRSLQAPEADRESGKHPVVVISHGYPGSRMLLSNLAENLSSKGYVVVSIGHTDNTYEDFLAQRSMESAWIHRTLDQRFVISQLSAWNAEGFLKDMLDLEKVALIGFSMGGYGALRTIGAHVGTEMKEQLKELAEAVDEPEWHGDPAVKACVLFAPAVFWFDPARTEDIRIPTLWFCGTADKTVRYTSVRSFFESCTNSERILVSYTACGHNVANNPAPECAGNASWEIYKRWADPVWDTNRLNNINVHFVTAFLDATLFGGTGFRYFEEPLSETPRLGFVDGGDAGVSVLRMHAQD